MLHFILHSKICFQTNSKEKNEGHVKKGWYPKLTNKMHPKNHFGLLYKTEETPSNCAFSLPYQKWLGMFYTVSL